MAGLTYLKKELDLRHSGKLSWRKGRDQARRGALQLEGGACVAFFMVGSLIKYSILRPTLSNHQSHVQASSIRKWLPLILPHMSLVGLSSDAAEPQASQPSFVHAKPVLADSHGPSCLHHHAGADAGETDMGQSFCAAPR